MAYEKGSKYMKQQEQFVPKETLKEVLEYPFRGLESRGVRKDTCEKFGVRAGVSEVDGKTVEAFYFPSYNQKGKITGYKKQDITKDKRFWFFWKNK